MTLTVFGIIMKTSLLFFLCFCIGCNSKIEVPSELAQEMRLRFIEHEIMERLVDSYKFKTENVLNIKNYECKVFIGKTFSEFTETEKKLFLMWQCELLLFRMEMIKVQNESMMKIRKSHAVNFENFIEKTFNEIDDIEISKTEKIEYLNRIKSWNNDQKLIERKCE